MKKSTWGVGAGLIILSTWTCFNKLYGKGGGSQAENQILLTMAVPYHRTHPSAQAAYVFISDYLMSPDVMLVSDVSLGNLSDHDQSLLEKCAMETRKKHEKLLIQMQKEHMEEAKEFGVQITSKFR